MLLHKQKDTLSLLICYSNEFIPPRLSEVDRELKLMIIKLLTIPGTLKLYLMMSQWIMSFLTFCFAVATTVLLLTMKRKFENLFTNTSKFTLHWKNILFLITSNSYIANKSSYIPASMNSQCVFTTVWTVRVSVVLFPKCSYES